MRTRGVAAALVPGALATLLVALATAGPGRAAAPDGVGASTMTASVAEATLGDLVALTLQKDLAGSTTDPALPPVAATTLFRQLQLSSSTVTSGAPSLNQVVGEHQASAPAGPTDLTTATVDLDGMGLGSVVSGAIPPMVQKATPPPGAATSAVASIGDLKLLGGLASLSGVAASDTTGSGPASADTGRTMTVGTLRMLDLGRLLQGLGLDVLNLRLSVVSGLVTSFAIPLGVAGATDLSSLVTSMTDSIGLLLDFPSDTVDAALLQSLTDAGLPASLQPALGSDRSVAIADLEARLTKLIDDVALALEAANLLEVRGLAMTTVTKATGTVGTSVATAAGKVASARVGPVEVPGVDLAVPARSVDDFVLQVRAALAAVLAPLGFSDMLSLELFDRQTGVTQTAGVVKAQSSLTGLVVKLRPPSLTGLDHPDDGIGTLRPIPGDHLRSARRRAARRGTAARVDPNPLAGVLATALDGKPLLSRGLELRLGSVQSQSQHAVLAAVDTTTTVVPATTTTTTVPPASTTTSAPGGSTTTTTVPPVTTTRPSVPTTVAPVPPAEAPVVTPVTPSRPVLIPLSTPRSPAAVTPRVPSRPTPAAPNPVQVQTPQKAPETTPAGSLPRTGGEQTAFALLAMGLAAAALVARRLRRSFGP